MDLLFYFVSIITAIILMMYVLMIINYIIKWDSIENYDSKNHPETSGLLKTTVTIIVAVRNEAENIITLLKSLVEQNYPPSLFEIYIVDDHSEDATAEVVNNFIVENTASQIKLIQLQKINPDLQNKKAAIQTGIEQSTAEFIITTDGDCTMDKNWLATIVSCYELHQPKMIVAPVLLTGNSFFERMQQLEFLSLIATTASAIKAGKPLMCNGANLAYSRKIFFEAGGFDSNNKTATGDDTFLMFKIWKLYPSGIRFLKSNNAIVRTVAQKNLSNFIQQRIRWASKTKQYKLPHVTRTGLLIAAINLLLILLAALSFFELKFLALLTILYIVKFVVDAIYLFKAASFLKLHHLKSLPLLFITTLLYPFYILYTGIKSQTSGYQWKDRSYQK